MSYRSETIRIAASLPVGDPTRKKLLAALTGKAYAEPPLGRQPTLKLLADTINRVPPVKVKAKRFDGSEGEFDQLDGQKITTIIKRWFAHADKDGAAWSECGIGTIKQEFVGFWEVPAEVREVSVWDWNGKDTLSVKVSSPGGQGPLLVSITDKNGRIVFDSDSTPKAKPSQVVYALVLDRPQWVSNRVWEDDNEFRTEKVRDWESDIDYWG